ncbi:MAG: hypothetical protein OJF50_000479 [Nitrospira sp.]|jgi:hypothetical protein|nr:hypothetical protein [Nitrospira sp.]
MNASAAIADSLLRRAFGGQARPLATSTYCFKYASVPWSSRARLAARLRDFATNRHE